MLNNIEGELFVFKSMNIKPNFSELSRLYGIDRHTVAKMWKNGGIKKLNRKPRKSRLDPYKTKIDELLSKPGVNIKGAYEYMTDHYGSDIIGSYNNFRHYIWKNDMKPIKNKEVHVRFETPPGVQMQVDWKENMKITTKHGEIIAFNILTATLGYSRLHIFIYSRSKTTEDFIRCVIDALQILGGAPRHILTDNMSAVVSITNGTRYKHQKIRSFEKDTNIRIKLCKPKHPETKGKDESSNRFLSWLYAYDGEIENEKELIELIGKINLKVNDEINQTTKLPPIVLFQKEKEYLNPLPNRILLEDYVEDVETKTVPPTLLVSYKGSGYSVPKEFIGKRVKLVPCDNKLYIYSNTKLVTVHDITSRRFNYQTDDYVSALKTSIHNKDIDIEKIAEENLRLLEEII